MRIALKELLRQPGRFVPVGVALTLLVMLLVVLGGFLDGLELSQTGAYRAHDNRLLVFAAMPNCNCNDPASPRAPHSRSNRWTVSARSDG